MYKIIKYKIAEKNENIFVALVSKKKEKRKKN